MRVTLLGGGGQLGAELSAALAPRRPDVIVNAAAYTAVDRAEAGALLDRLRLRRRQAGPLHRGRRAEIV